MTEYKTKELLVVDGKKKHFVIDWASVMDKEQADQVPELEIVTNTKPPPPPPTFLSGDQIDSQKSLTDRALNEQLERNKSHLVTLGPGLPDKGERIRLKIASLEEEKQRRVLQRSQMDVDRSLKTMQSTSSGSDALTQRHAASNDTSRQGNTDSKDTSRQRNTDSKDTSRQGSADSKEVSRSTFAAFFTKPKADTQSKNAFGKELEDLGCGSQSKKAFGKERVDLGCGSRSKKAVGKEREDSGCESRKHKADRRPVTRLSSGWRMLPDIGKAENSEKQFSSGLKGSRRNQKSKDSSSYSLVDDDDNDHIGHETPRDWSWEEYPSHGSKRRKQSDDTVINVDEEEPRTPTVEEQAVELPEGLQEDICYPSRDDPNFVQVCLKDLECLAPREFLTSPVMNFYIRFLQQQISSSNQISADCHFFNTYFYKKLSDAVTYKGNDKAAFFVKFRRWWKGIDLFRKAYIFIPIHEDLHWSLVIVCIPDKKDETGITILHLDSLGLHSRRSIVENVKRFLKDEWHYLNQDGNLSDLPISEKVWKNLPRRISEADIQVPQQKNDFDCGPFVLFFIKRFIEEAPQRLERKDLGMFDKKWFRPDEASALRIKIRNTLIELFRVSDQTDQTSTDNAATSKSRHCSSL
ncbi:PREDICTED: ubiquitin-like-specific protease 1D [Camelina sativa]|uniref:Ubiquitin-like-specific protease 1D n=1 Tax=Camelina sativa TaxID=90675 RepID=A0ABM0WMG4_CAMSA|nr:PREDICTED: ubiquitin-like-specific protease 1D [Camelina sativa]